MQYFHAHTSQACPQFTMNFTGYNIKHLVLPHEMDKNTRPIDEILRGSKASREHIRGKKPLKSQMNDKEKNSTKNTCWHRVMPLHNGAALARFSTLPPIWPSQLRPSDQTHNDG